MLDFSTGRLQGAMLNAQSGEFTNFWFANLAEDFKTKGKGGAKYAIIPGNGFLTANNQGGGGGGGGTQATGLLYVAELNSGLVGCYRLQYRTQMAASEPMPLQPVNSFSFREAQK